MLTDKYVLFFKTGDAEIRALHNLECSNKNIFPIIEITRGRKSKNDSIGLIEKRLDKIESIFKGREVCLDLTTASDLSNPIIENMFDPSNGYKAWVDFLVKMKEKKIFKEITPTILIDSQDIKLKENLRLEVNNLSYNFNSIAYRNSITDDACYEDVANIQDIVTSKGLKFLFIIDCEYIAPGAWLSYAEKITIRINKLKSILKNTTFAIVSTSFPRYVSDIGQEESDTFRLNEIDLFKKVIEVIGNKNIYYGDYGSINPIRNDLVVMSRGWVPRIDVPLSDKLYYYRKKRNGREYSDIYIELARDYVMVDPRYPKKIKDNWGLSQIKLCAEGNAPGSSPSFWISVRMNVHIHQQLLRLGLLK